MFLADIPAHPPTPDPWLTPLADRLDLLARGSRRVAYYCEEPNTSTFRYRVYNMAQVLNADPQERTSAAWFHRADLGAAGTVEQIVANAEILVVNRSVYDAELAHLMGRFKRQGKPVLFDIDDLIFDRRFVHLVLHVLSEDHLEQRIWDYWFSLVSRLEATLQECDGAIATTPFLADRVRESSGKPTAVMPNFMNREQLAISNAAWQAKVDSGFARDGQVSLAYFSGSPHHGLDYAVAEPALEALLEARPDVTILTVGYLWPKRDWSRFGDRVQRAPFQDWINLQRLIARSEVNLMPLLPSVFTDGKSPLKYFEAAAVGTVSVASPAATYADCIEDGRNGFLARGHEWQRQLERLLDAMDQYPTLATQARHDALARFSWTVQRPALLQALGWA